MVDLGILYLRGLPSQHISKNPYRARSLFKASLLGVDKIVYEQKVSSGSVLYTVETVNRWLGRIPAPITRLQLGGLQGDARAREINDWKEVENQLLKQKLESATVEEIAAYRKEQELIEQQSRLLLDSE